MTVTAAAGPLDSHEVVIQSKRYWLKGDPWPTERKVSQWASPQRTGNPERADQQFLSELIWDDTTGGLGVINMDEKNFPDRISDSSVETRIAKQWLLAPKKHTVTITGAALTVAPVGIVTVGIYDYVVAGTGIKRLQGVNPDCYYYDTGTNGWVNTGGTEYTLPAAAQSVPIYFKAFIWIPCGTGGLVKYDPAAVTFTTILTAANCSGSASYGPQWLTINDEDLQILNQNGKLYSCDSVTPSGAANPSADLTFRGSVDTFSYLQGIVTQRDFLGNPAIWVASDRGLHLNDYTNAKFYTPTVKFGAPKSTSGLGLTEFDGSLFFGKDANAHELTSSTRLVRGPNTGDGLVSTKQGYMVNFDPSLDNGLIGVMNGGAVATSSVLYWNRKGWHSLVEGSHPTASTTLRDYGLGLVGYAIVGYAEVGNPRVTVYDSFDRTNDATTLNTGTSGTAWSAVAGTWGVISNTGYLVTTAAAAAPNVAVVESLLSSTTVGVTLSTNPTGTRVVVREADASNYIYLENNGTGYDLIKRVAGVNTTLATYTMTTAAGDKIIVVLNGTLINVYINGFARLSATTSSGATNTKHGIGTATGVTSARFDDFIVGGAFLSISYCHFSPVNVPGYLYYNEGSNLKYIKMYDTTDNAYQFPTNDFESSGSLTFPFFDADLAELQKTAFTVQIRGLGMSSAKTATVYYQIDNNTTAGGSGSGWVQMLDVNGAAASMTADGLQDLYFVADDSSDEVGQGVKFRNLRLRLDLASNDPTSSPLIFFLKVRYLRELPVLLGHDIQVDLTREQPDGRTPEEATSDLYSAILSRKKRSYAFRNGLNWDTKQVLILSYSGSQMTGSLHGGFFHLTLVEPSPNANDPNV